MTYDISFKEQIVVNKNSLVFGWTNYVHGYHNSNNMPLHILVFATLENNLSVYNQSKLPIQEYTGIRKIEKLDELEHLIKQRIAFSSIPPKDFTDTLMIDLESQYIEYGQFRNNDSHNKIYVTFKLFV